jgi:hypothetical protein
MGVSTTISRVALKPSPVANCVHSLMVKRQVVTQVIRIQFPMDTPFKDIEGLENIDCNMSRLEIHSPYDGAIFGEGVFNLCSHRLMVGRLAFIQEISDRNRVGVPI